MRVVLFHPMQQHSYKTAEGLIDAGVLYEYRTCIFYQPRKIIYKLLGAVLDKDNLKRMLGRTNGKIAPYVKTSHTFLGLLFLLVFRIDKKGYASNYLQFLVSHLMGMSVVRHAIRENVDVIIAYDTWAHGVLKEIRKRNSNIKVVIDYSSLYAEEILRIINEDIRINRIGTKAFEKSLIKFSPKYMKAFMFEKDQADYFFSPSSVVDKSLIDYGVSPERILRCTYGSYFKQTSVIEKTYETVTFVYIGRMSYAKGVHYLIDAFNRITRPDCKLLLIGANTDGIIEKIKNPNIRYVGLVQHDEIPSYLKESDVVISASMYDGFSLAILEASAYNLPILCTKNNGVVDYVTKKNGISFDIQSSEQIYNAVMGLMNDKTRISKLSHNVGNILKELTWENYYIDIRKSVEIIMYGGTHYEGKSRRTITNKCNDNNINNILHEHQCKS